MRHLTIALLLPSAIHSAGITALLRKMSDTSVTIKEVSGDSYPDELNRLRPSVIIADPIIGGIDWSYFKGASSFPVKLIALLSQQMPKQSLADFDDSVSVYDSPEQINDIISRNVTAEQSEDRTKELSPREKEVVVGIVKGLSNKEIAATMNVSVNTVMTHRRNIAAKLHIHTPAGLTIYAIVSNLVSLEEIKSGIDRI